MPGENDVPKEVWAHAKETKAIKIWMDAGILEERTGKAQPLPTKATGKELAKATGRRMGDLSEFDFEQIQNIVADTDDLALLATWSDDEREEVQSLVRARMSAVKKAKKPARSKRKG